MSSNASSRIIPTFLIDSHHIFNLPISNLSINESQGSNTSRPHQKLRSSTDEMPDAKEKIIQDQEHWLQQQDDELVKLREQCQKLWISNDRHDAEIQALMEVLAKSSRDLEQLQKTNLSQHHELQTCKDNLFRLQPVTQLTDSDILKQYETLCQQVSNWVDNELSKFEDKSGYPVNDTRIITDGGSNSIKRLLNSTPEAGEYLVSAEIHENIQRHFFGENVILFGLSQNITGFLHCVEEHMATLEPRRGMLT